MSTLSPTPWYSMTPSMRCLSIRIAVMGLLGSVSLASADGMDLQLLLHQGTLARKAGDFERSIAIFERAVVAAKEQNQPIEEWSARNLLAQNHKWAGNLAKAKTLHENNIHFLRQQPEGQIGGLPIDGFLGTSLEHLAGITASQGDSVSVLKQHPALKEDGQLTAQRPMVLEKIGINQYLAGKIDQAAISLKQALESYERTMQKGLLGWHESPYEWEVEVIRWLQKVRVAQGRPNEALALAELGRARGLSARLGKRFGARLDTEVLDLRGIVEMARDWNATLVEYSLIYEYDPDLPLRLSEYEQIPVSEIFIWVIQPDGSIHFRRSAPPSKQGSLVDLVRVMREDIGARGRGVPRTGQDLTKFAGQEKLREFYQVLVQPVEDLLPKNPKRHVIFIPQDLLFLVPYASLIGPDGRYLIEKHTILTAPSLMVLNQTRQRQRTLPATVTGVLVAGNPTMPTLTFHGGSTISEQLPDLPGAETEAQTIAKYFDAQAITGNQATKSTVLARMPEARLVHLATHGILDDTGVHLGSLAFAPEPGDRGFLTAREIRALRLNAELVVLSACDTGRGRITGDGVLGLSRSVLAAGASSVLVSLWAVSDEATALLMQTFYQHLRRGDDKAQALRLAMLSTMGTYPEPVEWAAFALVGEGAVSSTMRQVSRDSLALKSPWLAFRHTVFPVPEDIQVYREEESRRYAGEVDISFDTRMEIPFIISLYRDAFSHRGFVEEERFAQQSADGFELVFLNGKRRVVVSGMTRNVLRTDSAEWQPVTGVFIKHQ